MSIIVRHPETGKLIIMTKGADSMILARLAPNEPGRQQVEADLVGGCTSRGSESNVLLCRTWVDEGSSPDWPIF